jgi:hypothetical protein
MVKEVLEDDSERKALSEFVWALAGSTGIDASHFGE